MYTLSQLILRGQKLNMSPLIIGEKKLELKYFYIDNIKEFQLSI